MKSNVKQLLPKLFDLLILTILLSGIPSTRGQFFYRKLSTNAVHFRSNFSWMIHDFSSIMNNHRKIESPKFPTTDSEIFFKVDMHITGNQIKLTIFLIHPTYDKLKGDFTVSVLNAKDIIVYKRYVPNYLIKKDKGFVLDPFLTKHQLNKYRKKYLQDGHLVIFCDIYAMLTVSTSSRIMPRALPQPNWFSNRLDEYWTNPSYTDVDILIGDNKMEQIDIGDNKTEQIAIGNNMTKLIAHKVVLAGGSKVMAELLEGEDGLSLDVIIILNAKPNITTELIQFMYSGKIDPELKIDTSRLQDLWEMSSKLDVLGLKEACEEVIYNNVKYDNARHYYDMATKFQQEDLSGMIYKFMEEAVKNSDPGFDPRMSHDQFLEAYDKVAYLKSLSSATDYEEMPTIKNR